MLSHPAVCKFPTDLFSAYQLFLSVRPKISKSCQRLPLPFSSLGNRAARSFFEGSGTKMKTPNDRSSFAMHLFGYAASYLHNPNDGEVVIHGFPLAWLLPTKTRDTKSEPLEYVNYKGSLTTPPCSEVVDWIVITGRTLEINEKTAKYFKAVKNSIGTAMSGNARPVQELNGRKVYGVKGMI